MGHLYPYRRGWSQDEEQEEAAPFLKVQSSTASCSATGLAGVPAKGQIRPDSGSFRQSGGGRT